MIETSVCSCVDKQLSFAQAKNNGRKYLRYLVRGRVLVCDPNCNMCLGVGIVVADYLLWEAGNGMVYKLGEDNSLFCRVEGTLGWGRVVDPNVEISVLSNRLRQLEYRKSD